MNTPPRQGTPTLALLALGVVYGDIGTSPLYAVKETFNPEHGIALTPANIVGGLSTLFWMLMIVVSLKYVILVMRADNRGEGGIMALLALATASMRSHPAWTPPLLLAGVFGASLFYGDAVLTPAISVLSAVEGLEVGTAAFKPYIVPIATGILVTAVVWYFVRQRDRFQQRSDDLLHNILPDDIAARLKEDDTRTIADDVDAASVLFADVVAQLDAFGLEPEIDVHLPAHDLARPRGDPFRP